MAAADRGGAWAVLQAAATGFCAASSSSSGQRSATPQRFQAARAAPVSGSLAGTSFASSCSAAATVLLLGAGTLRRLRRRSGRSLSWTSRQAVVIQPGEKVVGIDLGTTTSVIAAVEAGEPTVIPNSEGEQLTPSIVAITKDKELLVGQAAKRQAVLNPLNTYDSVKRFVGCRYREIEEEADRFSYKVESVDDKVRLDCPVLGKKLVPEEVSAHILSKLKNDAAKYLSADVNKAVVTVPAYFNDAQRHATRDAGKIAGLEVLRIANEPTMAALAYGLDRKQMAVIMVVDLGGGTFDVSLMEVGDGVMEVMVVTGDAHLGGNDFDQRIIDWLLKDFQAEHGVDLSKDKQAMQRLKEAAEQAKIDLSGSQETRISIPFIAGGADGPLHIDGLLSRQKFEELCEDLLKRIKAPITQAMLDGRVTKRGIGSLQEVVLVGGASRMPCLERTLQEVVGQKSTNSAIDPEKVVALGAAVQAAMISGEVRDIMLIDVTPLSLGVETNGGVFTTVVERNTAIPTKVTKFFTTSEDGQDEIEVVVLQGERAMAKDNKCLGKFRLQGFPPAPAGVPKIEVAFEINLEGLLTVTAKDFATRREQKITVSDASTLEEWEVEEIMQDAMDNETADWQVEEHTELRYKAQTLLKHSEYQIAELGSKSPEDQRQKVIQKMSAVKACLGDDVSDETIDHTKLGVAFKGLEYELMILGQRVYGKQLAPDSRPGPAAPRRTSPGVSGGGSEEEFARADEDEEGVGAETVGSGFASGG
eukprot:TRINITY_DN37744_c0_g1_i1.p1 TRINITY_DN37744_c0_g1~~TRINITY_DN37744_c0_g1_i1.p1  ORF type:complete len:857 (-),score=240.86 TRINITY_DN37744_c0_g1_i1:49-2322(-)